MGDGLAEVGGSRLGHKTRPVFGFDRSVCRACRFDAFVIPDGCMVRWRVGRQLSSAVRPGVAFWAFRQERAWWGGWSTTAVFVDPLYLAPAESMADFRERVRKILLVGLDGRVKFDPADEGAVWSEAVRRTAEVYQGVGVVSEAMEFMAATVGMLRERAARPKPDPVRPEPPVGRVVHDLPETGPDLTEDFRLAINRRSAENGSDTPDFILAGFLAACLRSFDRSVRARERWYGRMPVPASASSGLPVPGSDPAVPGAGRSDACVYPLFGSEAAGDVIREGCHARAQA